MFFYIYKDFLNQKIFLKYQNYMIKYFRNIKNIYYIFYKYF